MTRALDAAPAGLGAYIDRVNDEERRQFSSSCSALFGAIWRKQFADRAAAPTQGGQNL